MNSYGKAMVKEALTEDMRHEGVEPPRSDCNSNRPRIVFAIAELAALHHLARQSSGDLFEF